MEECIMETGGLVGGSQRVCSAAANFVSHQSHQKRLQLIDSLFTIVNIRKFQKRRAISLACVPDIKSQ